MTNWRTTRILYFSRAAAVTIPAAIMWLKPWEWFTRRTKTISLKFQIPIIWRKEEVGSGDRRRREIPLLFDGWDGEWPKDRASTPSISEQINEMTSETIWFGNSLGTPDLSFEGIVWFGCLRNDIWVGQRLFQFVDVTVGKGSAGGGGGLGSCPNLWRRRMQGLMIALRVCDIRLFVSAV